MALPISWMAPLGNNDNGTPHIHSRFHTTNLLSNTVPVMSHPSCHTRTVVLQDLAHIIEHDHDKPFPPSTIDDAGPVHCIRVSISLVSVTLPFTHSIFAKQVVENHKAHVFYPHSTHSQLLAVRLGCIFWTLLATLTAESPLTRKVLAALASSMDVSGFSINGFYFQLES